jgi:high-affinity iron transporter
MLESFLITSRETLEASLVVGIVLATLHKTGGERYRTSVWLGVAAGVAASILAAVLFTVFAGGFEGTAEQIFEGVTMLVGAALLTTMILWMLKQRHVTRQIEQDVGVALHHDTPWVSHTAVFALAFVAIIREGVETVIFLNAANYASGVSFAAGLAGILAALALGYLCFSSFRKATLARIFTVSSVLLILFAAGLVAHGVHEFAEAGVLPETMQLFDLNPAVHADGSYPLMHEEGIVGSFFSSFFGYNGNPSLLEAVAYLAYLAPVLWLFWRGRTGTSKIPAA